MHQLQEWLNTKERNYAKGVHLYSLYGKYKSVLQLLQKGETPDSKTKLLESLRETWAALKPDIEQRTEAVKQVTAPVKVNEAKPAQPPAPDETVQKLDAKWKPMYSEMGMLHARLGVCDTDEQRYNLAVRITELESQIIAIWEQKEVYLTTGKLPAKAKKITKARNLPSSQHAELMNLRTYVTRMERNVLPELIKKQGEKPTKRRALRITENRAKLDGWKQRINTLENGG